MTYKYSAKNIVLTLTFFIALVWGQNDTASMLNDKY